MNLENVNAIFPAEERTAISKPVGYGCFNTHPRMRLLVDLFERYRLRISMLYPRNAIELAMKALESSGYGRLCVASCNAGADYSGIDSFLALGVVAAVLRSHWAQKSAMRPSQAT